MTDRAASGRQRRLSLLVVLSDPISPLVTKGEVTPRYYNPGDVFDHIDFLLLNDDRPDAASLRRMAGRASAAVHNLPLPRGLFARSLGWREPLMAGLIGQAVELARAAGPHLVRAYGAGLNALFANGIGRALRVPVVVSLHHLPDHIVAKDTKDWLRQRMQAGLAARVLRAAPAVLAVYRAQLPYLERIGVRAELAYNVIGADSLSVKSDYAVDGPLRLVSVGRQLPGKSIANLISAIGGLEGVELTVVGDGPLHDRLVSLAASLGLGARVVFVKAWSNVELCRKLATFDVFASHNLFPGLPKAVMEPMLAGLPVVMNSIGPGLDFELDDAALLVEDTVAGYRGALAWLQSNEAVRRSVGMACLQRALALWEPGAAEQRLAEHHRALIGDRHRIAP